MMIRGRPEYFVIKRNRHIYVNKIVFLWLFGMYTIDISSYLIDIQSMLSLKQNINFGLTSFIDARSHESVCVRIFLLD